MIGLINTFLKIIIFTLTFFSGYAFSDTLDKINITGNERISDETIKLFINIKVNDEIDTNKLNNILKDLYETDFFEDKGFNYTLKAKIRDRYSNYYQWLDENKSCIWHNGLQLDIFVYSKQDNKIITGFKKKKK